MEDFKKTKLVPGVIEGMAMFFLLLVFLFIFGKKYTDELDFPNYDHCLYSFFPVLVMVWGLSKKFEPQINFILNAIYAFIVSFTLYVISDSYGDIEYTMFIVLLIVMVIAWLSMLYCKREQNQAEKNKTNPDIVKEQCEEKNEEKVELTQEQKRAVICLLAFIHGSSPRCSYNDEANSIYQAIVSHLGVSGSEKERILMESMNQDSEKEVDVIIGSLKELDKGYLKELYNKCYRIALISGREDMIKIVETIFEKELRVEVSIIDNSTLWKIIIVAVLILAVSLIIK